MKRKLLTFIVFLCTFFVQQNVNAQTTLAAGDIAFIGYQTASSDGFSFITLKDMSAGTLLYLTEKGWGNGTWVTSSTEPHLLWTIPAFTPAGTIVSIVETATLDTFTITGTTTGSITIASGAGFNLSGGDQMLAYQSSAGAEPASPTFIAGVHADYNLTDYDTTTTWNTAAGAVGGNESSLPPGLTNGVNCVSLFPGVTEVANSKYAGTLTGTKAALLASINNYANWSHHGTNDLGITPSGYSTPAVSTTVVATVTTATATSVKAVSAVMGGSLSADGGDSTVQRGIVWATTATPTIANNKVQNGTGTGTFSATITGLPSASTIHYRAYATNSTGTSYGTELTFNTTAGLSTSSTPQTNVSCNGGNNGVGTVVVTGGSTPYTYSWAPSGGTSATASNLFAGTYTVTITDGEATQITRNFTITEPTTLTGTPSTTAVSCFGGNNGTATIAASGGTPGYTYSWAPSGGTGATATGLAAGTYSVTITDANSCTKTITGIVVGGPTATLGGTPSATNVSCFGGSNGVASITPTGGTPGYTYLWNTGETTPIITGLVAGNYSVLITDANSCQITIQNIIVGEPATAVSGTVSKTDASCNGGTNGTATVTATGGTPSYTYSWAPSGGTGATASGLAAGTYSVTITDANSCTYTINNITIGQPSALGGTPSTTSVLCNGGSNGTASVVASGGTPGYTYSWSPSGGTAATATGLTAGTYSVTITDANSCTYTVNNIIVGQSTVINANPSQINVSCNGGSNGSATVTPTGGAGSYTYLWSNAATTASISGLTAGTYTVTITDANLCEKTQSFTITEPPVLVASQGTINNVSCNGGANGSATVILTGGTTPYTYDWNGTPIGDGTATISGLSAGTYTVTVTDNNLCQTTQSFTITEPAVLSVATLQTDILCNGAATGSATVNATGGTGTYTYSWAPTGGTAATATGLTAGTYTVTVKDANLCQITQSFTITQPSTLIATPVAQTNIGCRGDATGSATVNVTGGTGTYTYSWAPSGGTAATATGLIAGTYTVTIKDANLCQTTQSFTITQPAAILSATTASIGVSCFGGSNGSAGVTASGGTPGYTYLWAPLGGTSATITGRPAGNYTCTITDANGCTLVKNITISTPTILSATASKTDVSCNGGTNGTATVTVSGGTSGYNYSWAPTGGTAATASGLSAGTYTVTVSDANLCQTTATVTVNQPAELTAMTSKTDVLCNGQASGTASVIVSGGTPGYTYLWSPSGGTAATATGLTVGNYTCTITDANGCFVSKNFTINQPAVLSSTTSQINATCITGGQAGVTPSGGTAPYTYIWSPSGGTASIATGLLAGNYSCLITDANGCAVSKNFTITTTNTLVATTSKTDVLCNGTNTATATVVPSGAPGPFTYVWAPSGGTAATATGLTAGNYSVTITAANGCSIVKNFTITEPSAMTVTPAQTNITCNGGTNGSASVLVTGGTGGYTYMWSPSGGTAAVATGLSAGTYTVTIKDANLCQKTQSFIITEPNIITASSTVTNVSCNGANNGSATLNVTGGTGTYTYVWSPSGGNSATANGLAPGNYSVLITDSNNCTLTKNLTITEPAQLTATIGSQTNISCNGLNNGSATVNVTGGTGSYTYLWAPSGGNAATASGLSAGTHTVTVTDVNNCTTTQSFTITEPSLLTATVGTQTNVSCNGGNNGSATVSVTGGTSAYTYAWSPSGGNAATASGLSAGTYTVTVTDANSCTASQIFTITEPNLLTATAGVQTNISCNGGSNGSATVNVTGGTGSYSYVWSPSGGTTATASGLAAGTYTVTITDANNCTATQSFNITEPNALTATIATQTNISCNGLSDGAVSVNITGGVTPYSYLWSNGSTTKDISGLTAGNYTLTVTDANNCSVTQSVILITIPDVTAPVPTVASLPEITNYCSILSSQIPIPTATDNCAGIVNGTTANPLNYTTEGSYTITWSFNDGNGNISTQNQTLKVIASPVNQVTFSNAEYTFDGNLHTLQVANLPAGASVAYTTSPATGTANGATNAGTYAITATVTPSVTTPNCSPVTLTANLTIKKAAQQITFGALAPRILGSNNDFNLQAISNSGLPVRFTFTYTSTLPPANVSATGLVNLLRSGELLITAHQDGNQNYLPAVNVSQLLVIKNNDITVQSITIGSKVYTNPAKDITYLMACGENNPNIAIVNQTNATITPAASFAIATPKPGIYAQNVTITSQDGTATANYTIKVEKPFAFYDIVKQKFNNVLLVNNNPQTNGGYEFVSYQWFKNGQLVGTGQYYSAGDESNSILDTSAVYSVKMTTKDGKVLQTCGSTIVLQNSLQAKLYPNPIEVGKVITVEADFPEEDLQNMQITLFSVSGQLIKTVQSSTAKTEIQLPETTEGNMYLVVLETGNIKKSFKVIVK